jgi:hypothetical protein
MSTIIATVNCYKKTVTDKKYNKNNTMNDIRRALIARSNFTDAIEIIIYCFSIRASVQTLATHWV